MLNSEKCSICKNKKCVGICVFVGDLTKFLFCCFKIWAPRV